MTTSAASSLSMASPRVPREDALNDRGVGRRVLNFAGHDVDTVTPAGSRVCMVIAALPQREPEIQHKRIADSVDRRRVIGPDLGERCLTCTDSQIPNSQMPNAV
jgi:hypothetical protein